MSFDALAPHYRWMEFFLAGEKLQRCRLAFLSEIPVASHILLLGEGHGRFLPACRERFPGAHITLLDASAAMIGQSRRQMEKQYPAERSIEYLHADALAWSPPANTPYDLIVTHFFLDCFTPAQLQQLINKISGCAKDKANWLVADFQVAPEKGLARLRSRLLLRSMYSFFRMATGISAKKLTPPQSCLHSAGFRLQKTRQTEWGLLQTDWWQKTDQPGGQKPKNAAPAHSEITFKD